MTFKSVFYRIKSISKKDFKFGILLYVLVSHKPFDRVIHKKFYRKLYLNHIMKVYQKIQTPTRVDIEATNICNADCVFCPRHSHTRKQRIMDIELFKKIVDDLLDIKTLRDVCLSGFGEPLLDKNLPEKIKYCKDKNHNWKTIIFTNGAYLNEEISNKILDSGLDVINFSFNGGTKDVYEKIMKIDFDNVKSNIERFIKLRNERGQKNPFVVVSCVLTKESLNDEVPFRNLWNNRVDQIVVVKPHDWVGNIGSDVINIGQTRYSAFPCRLILHPFINWDGIISLCCHDYNEFTNFGDLNKQSFMDIWNSEKYKNFRQRNVDGNLDSICATCEVPITQSSKHWWEPV